jgi:hypothetical protein
VLGGALSVCFVVVLLVERPTGSGDVALFAAVSGAFAALALWAFRWCRNSRNYTVIVRHDGLQIGESNWIPWTAVGHVRERPCLQRVDLFDVGGRRLGAIEYQVEGAAEVISEVTEHLRKREPRNACSRFGRSFTAAHTVDYLLFFAGSVAASVWCYADGHWLLGLVFLSVMAWAAYADFRGRLRELQLEPEGLVLRTVLRQHTIEWRNIAGVFLMMNSTQGGGQALSVVAVLHDGPPELICPAGASAIEVSDSVRSWLADHCRVGQQPF